MIIKFLDDEQGSELALDARFIEAVEMENSIAGDEQQNIIIFTRTMKIVLQVKIDCADTLYQFLLLKTGNTGEGFRTLGKSEGIISYSHNR